MNLDGQQILESYESVNVEGIKAAATSLTLIAPLLGRPQGWTYDRVREQFGLESKGSGRNEIEDDRKI